MNRFIRAGFPCWAFSVEGWIFVSLWQPQEANMLLRSPGSPGKLRMTWHDQAESGLVDDGTCCPGCRCRGMDDSQPGVESNGNGLKKKTSNVERSTLNVERSQEPHLHRDVKLRVKKLQSFHSMLGVQRSTLDVQFVKIAAERQPIPLFSWIPRRAEDDRARSG